MQYKFILSDLDGVIRQYPVERNSKIEKKFNLPEGSILKCAFDKSILEKVVCGTITDDEWRHAIETSLSQVSDAQMAKQAMMEWNDFPGVIDYDYLKFLEMHYGHAPVVVLTNGTTRLKADLQKLGVINHFHRIFNSAEIGFCKPDRRIFDHVLKELNCQPEDILFIDDSLSHVTAAKELGFAVHHYKSLEILKMS